MKRLLVMGLGCVLLILSHAGTAPAQSRKAQELIKDLKDKDPKIRASAAEDIGRLAQVRLKDAREALPALQAAQKDPDPVVRKAVLGALVLMDSDPKNVLTLYTDTLKRDRFPVVQLAVVSALGQMQPPPKDALPALTEAHKAGMAAQRADIESVLLRAAIVNLMARIEREPEKTVPLYIDVLKRDKNLSNRVTAVRALEAIGPKAKAAVPTLLEMQKTAKALKGKDQGLGQAVEAALERIRSAPKK